MSRLKSTKLSDRCPMVKSEQKSILWARKWWRHGQSILDYALVLVIVSAAWMAMGLYVRRAAEGNINNIQQHIDAKKNKSSTYGYTTWGWPI